MVILYFNLFVNIFERHTSFEVTTLLHPRFHLFNACGFSACSSILFHYFFHFGITEGIALVNKLNISEMVKFTFK